MSLDAGRSGILFLDMDGVCCSERAAFVFGPHCIEPMAVHFLNLLYRATPYYLVASSSRRKEYPLPGVLEAVACIAPFAKPWRTEADAERPQAIAHWLANNAPTAAFAILDDQDFDWLPGQRERWISCDPKNGIGLDDMRRAFRIFGASPPEIEFTTK